MRNIVGAYHIAMMNNWREIVDEQVARMAESYLLEVTDRVFVGVVGGKIGKGDLHRDLARKAIIACSPNLTEYEFWTLRMLHDFSAARDFKAWYVHTKGVSREPKQSVTNWRRLMEYFIIDRFKICIRELDSCDACGVNVITQYRPARFFAGNFWWSNSRHMSKLPRMDDLVLSDRFQAEHWIGGNSAELRDLYDGNRNAYCIESLRRSHPAYVLKSGAFWNGRSLTNGERTTSK